VSRQKGVLESAEAYKDGDLPNKQGLLENMSNIFQHSCDRPAWSQHHESTEGMILGDVKNPQFAQRPKKHLSSSSNTPRGVYRKNRGGAHLLRGGGGGFTIPDLKNYLCWGNGVRSFRPISSGRGNFLKYYLRPPPVVAGESNT